MDWIIFNFSERTYKNYLLWISMLTLFSKVFKDMEIEAKEKESII